MDYKKRREVLENLDVCRTIDEELTKPRFKGKAKHTHHPSAASIVVKGNHLDFVVGGCLRKEYYRLSGAPATEPISAYLAWMGKLGLAVEDIVTNALVRASVLESDPTYQVTVYDKVTNLSGRLDGLIKNDNGELVILEVKSFHGYYAHKEIMGHSEGRGSLRRWVRGQPKPGHLLQTAIYAYQLREETAGAKLLYIARDDSDRIEFNVIPVVDDSDPSGPVWRVSLSVTGQRDPLLVKWFSIEGIHTRLEELDRCLEEQVVPKRDYYLVYPDDVWEKRVMESEQPKFEGLLSVSATQIKNRKAKHKIGDWQCNGCMYQTLCYSTED